MDDILKMSIPVIVVNKLILMKMAGWIVQPRLVYNPKRVPPIKFKHAI